MLDKCTIESCYIRDCSFIISQPFKYIDNGNASRCFVHIICYCETPCLHEIHEHNSKLSRISSKWEFPLLCIRLRCKNQMIKTEQHFYSSTLNENSLWSGKDVGRGNILVCSRYIRLNAHFQKWVKTSLCHATTCPYRVSSHRKFFVCSNLGTQTKEFEVFSQQKLKWKKLWKKS